MRIKFLQDHQVEAKNGKKYFKDEVHDMPEASADHFIGRGVAVEAPEEKEKRRQSPSTLVRKDQPEEKAEEGKEQEPEAGARARKGQPRPEPDVAAKPTAPPAPPAPVDKGKLAGK